VRQLRDLTRRRVQLTKTLPRAEPGAEATGASQCEDWQVLTDVFGVSGLHMLLALLDGGLRQRKSLDWHAIGKRKTPQLIEALEGIA